MINWEVILWTCITIAVLMGIIAMILTIISAVNMRKKREAVGDIHTSLKVGTRVMFAGGFVGKIARINDTDEIIGIEVAPKLIVDVSRFAVQQVIK